MSRWSCSEALEASDDRRSSGRMGHGGALVVMEELDLIINNTGRGVAWLELECSVMET